MTLDGYVVESCDSVVPLARRRRRHRAHADRTYYFNFNATTNTTLWDAPPELAGRAGAVGAKAGGGSEEPAATKASAAGRKNMLTRRAAAALVGAGSVGEQVERVQPIRHPALTCAHTRCPISGSAELKLRTPTAKT